MRFSVSLHLHQQERTVKQKKNKQKKCLICTESELCVDAAVSQGLGENMSNVRDNKEWISILFFILLCNITVECRPSIGKKNQTPKQTTFASLVSYLWDRLRVFAPPRFSLLWIHST